MSGSGFSELKQVKARVNISDTVTQADAKIQFYMTESDDYVDTQVGVHTTTPITNPDKELIALASSLAASFYNYWNKQGKMEDCLTCKKAIQDHIVAKFARKNLDTNLTTNTFVKTTSGIKGTET